MKPTRRTFLKTLTAATGSLAARAQETVTVSAEATVFYAHPIGTQVLVRFSVTGLDTPAGRLRVYDRGSRLLGTAGVINTGDALYGELWLELRANTLLLSELEAPGLRGVFRSRHRVSPGSRWLIHWITIADWEQVQGALGDRRPITRGIRSAILHAGNVTTNPLSTRPIADPDPLTVLHMTRPAIALEKVDGVPVSPLAWTAAPDPLDVVRVMALRNSGTRCVIRPWEEGATYEWWEGLDGSRLLAVPLAPNGSLRSLGFGQTTGRAATEVAEWLAASPVHLEPRDTSGRPGRHRVTFVIEDEVENAADLRLAVDDWNRTYAYPHVVLGPPDDLEGLVSAESLTLPTRRRSYTLSPGGDAPDRAASNTRIIHRTPSVLSSILANGYRGVEAIAREIRTDFPGTVVSNSTPFSRTDIVGYDGAPRVVTNVPAHGYAYFLRQEPPSLPAPFRAGVLTARSKRHRVRLDPNSGTIESIIDTEFNREWVGEGGLNALSNTTLESAEVEELPGLGVHLRYARRLNTGTQVRSTARLYDAVPWVTIWNEADPDGTHVERARFTFAHCPVEVLWEVSGGHHTSLPPTGPATFARWVWLRGPANQFFWSTNPTFSLDDNGTIHSEGPLGAGFRVMANELPVTLAEPARFGWQTVNLYTHPVAPNPRGRLPRFGSLFELDQPSAAIIAVEADNRHATSVTVYVQDLLGAARMISLYSDLVDFDDAVRVDYVGRASDEVLERVSTGVVFSLAALGVTAVRLLGVQLREV